DHNRKFVVGDGKFKRPVIDLDDVSKRRMAVLTIALGVDDLALVKGDVREMQIGFDQAQTGHSCALDHLNSAKYADECKIPRERHVRADLLRRLVAMKRKIRAPSTPDRLQPRSDGDTRIEKLSLLQTVVCEVKIFAADVQANESETLARGLVKI